MTAFDGESVLFADTLTVSYPSGLHALGPIDLSVKAGECVSILGPSGCGKSTLLASLTGLLRPTSGSARCGDGEPPGVVFQEPTLMPWASVAENVALPLKLAGRAGSEAAARAALTLAGLEEFDAVRPAGLSGGMRMRVSLARALVGSPKALLLDEPFAAIDELGRRSLDDLVLRLKAELKLAVLFVTHSVEEAVYLGDRVIIMTPRPGRIQADIAVPNEPRGDGFFTSRAFVDSAAEARSALALSKAA